MKRKLVNVIKTVVVGLTLCTALTIGMSLKGENKAHATGYYNINVNGGRFDGNTYTLNGKVIKNSFFCDGTYTYYLDHLGHPMKDKLTYHPNGKEIIYFDAYGHEVFDNFTHVVKSISGTAVDDYCYFNTYGYMYVDRLTFDRTGTKLYYINPYGQMEHKGLFSFSNGAMGYANYDGNLTRGQFQTILGNMFYFHSSGYSAQGLITDGCWYYNYDVNSRFLGMFPNVTHWVPASAPQETKPSHTHTWVAQTNVVHHNATGHYETVKTGTKTVVDKAAWDEEVFDYEEMVCLGIDGPGSCDFRTRSIDEMGDHCVDTGHHYTYEDHYKTVHHNAVTHTEPVYGQKYVVDKAAYDETVTTGYVCSGCGAKKQ